MLTPHIQQLGTLPTAHATRLPEAPCGHQKHIGTCAACQRRQIARAAAQLQQATARARESYSLSPTARAGVRTANGALRPADRTVRSPFPAAGADPPIHGQFADNATLRIAQRGVSVARLRLEGLGWELNHDRGSRSWRAVEHELAAERLDPIA